MYLALVRQKSDALNLHDTDIARAPIMTLRYVTLREVKRSLSSPGLATGNKHYSYEWYSVTVAQHVTWSWNYTVDPVS